jgi:hypothetical protein
VEGVVVDAKAEDIAPLKKNPSLDLKAAHESTVANELNDYSVLQDDDLETILNSTYENFTANETHDRQADMVLFHRTVKSLFEEEEALLNLHMSVIQVRTYHCGYHCVYTL